jgi:GNAT superfamily N-acetyltransferase
MNTRTPILDTKQRIPLLERALYEGFARLHGSEVIATPSWVQIVTPCLDNPMRNAICRSVSTEAEVDERIRETLLFYRSRNLRCSWVVGPNSRPRNLEERLVAAGFQLHTIGCGMSAELDELSLPTPSGSAPRVVIESLDERNLDDWIYVQGVVWGLSSQMAMGMREEKRRRAPVRTEGIQEYLIRVDGFAAAVGAIHLFDEFAHLSTGAVLPEFRNRGIFQHMVREALRVIRNLGHSLVTVHAIQGTSAPIFRKLGFQWDCDFSHYTAPPEPGTWRDVSSARVFTFPPAGLR